MEAVSSYSFVVLGGVPCDEVVPAVGPMVVVVGEVPGDGVDVVVGVAVEVPEVVVVGKVEAVEVEGVGVVVPV